MERGLTQRHIETRNKRRGNLNGKETYVEGDISGKETHTKRRITRKGDTHEDIHGEET